MEILFNERLKLLRREKLLSQTQLAEALEVTQRKVSYWETGQLEPDLSSLWKISEYFGVSTDFLLGKTDY